jgi:hypothetical protein
MPVPAILYYGGLGALRLAPAIMRAGSAGLKAIRGGGIQKGLKKYFTGTKGKYPLAPGAQGPTVAGTAPGIVRPGRFGANYLTQAGLGYGAYDYLTGDAEQSVADGQRTVPSPATPGGPAGMTIEEGEKAGIIKDKKEKPNDAKMTSDQIKSGELDDFIKERIDLFEKYIGDDTRKKTKTAGYNAMVQFGLNLATKRGSLVEGIAESAKEPLKEFAKLGNDLMDRAASIKKAGIEAGVSAYEKSEDRKIDREALATELVKEKLKQDAKTLSRGEFMTSALQDITSNETLMNALSDPYYKDGKRDPNAPSDSALAEAYAARQYDIYRAVEIPPGAAGQELYDSLPSGTRIYDPNAINQDGSKGGYATKP